MTVLNRLACQSVYCKGIEAWSMTRHSHDSSRGACCSKGLRGGCCLATVRAAASTRALVTFYFRLQISISRLQFFAVNWWIVVMYEYLEFAISFVMCQPRNIPEYTHVHKVLVQGHDHSGPRYADPPPFLRHWQLVLKVQPVVTGTRVLIF